MLHLTRTFLRCAAGFTAALWIAGGPALAVVGGEPVGPGDPEIRWTVRVEAGDGQLCTGVAIGRRLVLTAAHCVINGGSFRVAAGAPGGRPAMIRVERVAAHDSFLPGRTPSTQPGVDLAILRLARDLPAAIEPTRPGGWMQAGERVTIAGFGLGDENRASSARRLRRAELVSRGVFTSANRVMVAVDPARQGAVAGVGACRGDSGGPIMRAGSGELIGLVSWSSAPTTTRRRHVCGGFTAITPLAEHRDWIERAAQALEAPAPGSPGRTVPSRALSGPAEAAASGGG